MISPEEATPIRLKMIMRKVITELHMVKTKFSHLLDPII